MSRSLVEREREKREVDQWKEMKEGGGELEEERSSRRSVCPKKS